MLWCTNCPFSSSTALLSRTKTIRNEISKTNKNESSNKSWNLSTKIIYWVSTARSFLLSGLILLVILSFPLLPTHLLPFHRWDSWSSSCSLFLSAFHHFAPFTLLCDVWHIDLTWPNLESILIFFLCYSFCL